MIRRPITIVGCGQAGSSLAYHCLQLGHRVRILDARKEAETKENQQIPWGWYRKMSLQSELKRRVTCPDFPFPEFEGSIQKTTGPMLITTKNDEVVRAWLKWVDHCGNTDARVLSPAVAEHDYDLRGTYFGGKGGVFVCDTRDHLIDFQALNICLWDYFDAHPDCELVRDCEVYGVTERLRVDAWSSQLAMSATSAGTLLLDTRQGVIDAAKTVFTVGNQSSHLFPLQPIVQIRLPYATSTPPGHTSLAGTSTTTRPKYISLWNKDSSLLLYKDGTIKVACGVQSVFDPMATNWRTMHHFLAMGLRGWSNLHMGVRDEQLMDNAVNELCELGVNLTGSAAIGRRNDAAAYHQEWCNVDVTPNLCPYIYFPLSGTLTSAHKDVMSISGLSGSGTMMLDTRLAHKIVNSLICGELDPDLKPFDPTTQTIYSHWFPPIEKQTPLSSIV